jgi:hypothetical protein
VHILVQMWTLFDMNFELPSMSVTIGKELHRLDGQEAVALAQAIGEGGVLPELLLGGELTHTHNT